MFGTSKISSIVNASGCNIKTPGHVPLDVEKYPVAPDNLALEQVHVYVRHGVCCVPSAHRRVLTNTSRRRTHARQGQDDRLYSTAMADLSRREAV